MKISGVILTKNEESNIVACIQTLLWCDEIIVIDDNSTDTTVALTKKLGATVYAHGLDSNFSAQRNVGLEKAKGDWVLFVDADERVSSSLHDEIIKYTNNPICKYNGFYIQRLDSMWGRVLRHGEVGNIQLLRLAKKKSGTWKGAVHERWHVKGNLGRLTNPLMHYPHPTLTEFLQEINFYTSLRAEELYKQKITVPFWHILAYPKAKFFQNYLLKQGFRDGMPGIVVALCMSLHSFLVRGKLWQLWQKK